MVKPEGDQVGTPDGPNPRPWEVPFARLRLRELGYTLMSWPYLIAIGLTLNYILQVWLRTKDGPHAVNFQIASTAWLLAFARREWAAWQAGKQQVASLPPLK